MTLKIPPPPSPNSDFNDFTWKDWFRILRDQLVNTGVGAWSALNFSGSNITDIETRKHNDLQNVQGGGASEKYHLTAASYDPCSRMSWNTEMGTANLTMGYSNATGQLFQENYYPPVLNTTGSTLNDGTLVGFAGVSSGTPVIQKFIADGSMGVETIMGILTSNISNNDKGFATWFGYINNTNASGSTVGESWSVGDILYASPTTAGGLTKVRPVAPNLVISVAAVMNNSSTIGRLLVRVLPQPRLAYGTFRDTSTQTISTINTAQAITFNSTDISSGVSIGSPTSRVVATLAGRYEFTFTAQLDTSTSSTKTVYFWIRKNGTDVANTTQKITISGNTEVVAPTFTYGVSLGSSEYVQIMWAADSTNVSLLPAAATAFAPAASSIRLSVAQVNE